jgi:hypothetical protein
MHPWSFIAGIAWAFIIMCVIGQFIDSIKDEDNFE